MGLSTRMMASEILMVGLKQLPFVGTAVEAIQSLHSRYEMLRHQERLAEVEKQLTSFDRQLRGLVEKEIRTAVVGLADPGLSGSVLTDHIRNLRSIRQNGYDYALFEGLLRNSDHWDDLKKNPENYGMVLPDRASVGADGIHIFIDADRTRVLELTPFAFHALLARQRKIDATPTTVGTADVWALPGASSPGPSGAILAGGAKLVQAPSRKTPGKPKGASVPVASDVVRDSLGQEYVCLPHQRWSSLVPPGRMLYLARTCVSNGVYREFVRAGGPAPRIHPRYPLQRTWDDRGECPASMLSHPVVYVSHADALAFCRWLTARERKAGRIRAGDEYTLPRVEYWEAFARGVRLTSRTVLDRQWLEGRFQPTEAVDHERVNDIGLCCLLGNVFEWCLDEDEKEIERPGPGGKVRTRVKRFAALGGGWASSRSWLEEQVARESYGLIMCPHGWIMRDGGFRVQLVTTLAPG